VPLNGVPPILAFLAVVILFKIIGEAVQRKVIVAQKYEQDDARYYLWERMFQRVGICLGAFCGAIYFFALCVPIYSAGYFTGQYFREGEGTATIRLVNSLREGIVSQKLDRVVAGFNPIPAKIYEASDTIAMLLQNSGLGSRLSHYPVVAAMREGTEFKEITTDPDLLQAYQGKGSTADLFKNEKLMTVLRDPAQFTRLYEILSENLNDLNEYLKTGKSEKYGSEKILGNWGVNVMASVLLDRQTHVYPTVSENLAAQMNVMSKAISLRITATVDNKFLLRHVIPARENEEAKDETIAGTWSKSGDKYQANIPGNKPDNVDIKMMENGLIFMRDGVPVLFERQY
jgi:hypothetical protein